MCWILTRVDRRNWTVLSSSRGVSGSRGQTGVWPWAQVSSQHLLSALVSDTSEQGTDGCGDFCWRQKLATVATSSDATFP